METKVKKETFKPHPLKGVKPFEGEIIEFAHVEPIERRWLPPGSLRAWNELTEKGNVDRRLCEIIVIPYYDPEVSHFNRYFIYDPEREKIADPIREQIDAKEAELDELKDNLRNVYLKKEGVEVRFAGLYPKEAK